MRSALFLLALAVHPISSLPLGAQSDSGAVLVLRRANAVDPARGAIGRVTIVVRGTKIERIEPGDVQAPAGARVIDLEGRWVIPGMIDAHTHLSSLSAARRALESGVTTVRSAIVGAYQDVAMRELARRGAIAGPDVVAAGVFVTPDLGESMLADARLGALRGPVASEEQLRQVVRINLDRGVDVIKTRGTERAGLPNTDPRKQTYSEAQLRAIVQEAATRNIPVMAHAHGDEGAMAAVRAGVKSIEHGTYLSDSTLALMRQHGTWLVPTYRTVEDLTEPGGDYDDPVLILRGRHMLPRLAETVKRAHRMGVKIATGVDTNYGPESLSRVAHEVASFVDLGLTPLEALRTATTSAADLLGLSSTTGALRAGLDADLVVLEGNPLEDVRRLQDVLLVVSNGRVAVERIPFGVGR